MKNSGALRDRLAQGHELVSVTYADLPQTAKTTYETYMTLSQMMLSFAPPEVAEQSPGMILPPLGMILPHLEPAASAGWMEDDGIHFRSYSPFPGSSLLSQNSTLFGGGGVSMTAMGLGIILPALGAARTTAREMQTNTQARGIHQAAIMWSQLPDHKTHLPNELYPLLSGNYFTLEYLIAPSSSVEPPADFDQWPALEQQNWVRANASYVLLPDKRDTLDTTEIQLFGKPSHHKHKGAPVTYGDNRVVFETDLETVNRVLVEQTGKTMQQHIDTSEQPVQ